mmetsp:Transcript_34951/g.53659  ORF Transcript_34951/g.53659 Transcript_34951/m.53659 type:complete len:104 (-) Transcript_34951:304-615(-)
MSVPEPGEPLHKSATAVSYRINEDEEFQEQEAESLVDKKGIDPSKVEAEDENLESKQKANKHNNAKKEASPHEIRMKAGIIPLILITLVLGIAYVALEITYVH